MKSLEILMNSGLAAMLATGLSSCWTGNPAPVKSEAPLRLLVVTGGHDFERDPFFEMLGSFEGIAFQEAMQPGAMSLLNPALKESYDAVLFYDMTTDISEEQKTAFLGMMNGIGVVFLHHSLCSYPQWEEFETIIGGRYHFSEGSRDGRPYKASTYAHDEDVPVHIVHPGHPVLHGISDFILRDEVYGGFSMLPDMRPLLETDHPGSEKVIGWWHLYGHSRVVTIQPGHGREAFNDPSYRRLVRQAVLWTGRRSFDPLPEPLLTEWSGAGLLPSAPIKATSVFDITEQPGENWDEKLAACLRKSSETSGLSVIYFPPGVYPLSKPVLLPDPKSGHVVFQGASAETSILEFTLGPDGVCFKISGGTTGGQLRLDADLEKGCREFRAAGLSGGFRAGDWVMLCEANFPEADPGNVGQITRLSDVNGDRGVFKDAANKMYLKKNDLWILKVLPVENVGFENLALRRMDKKRATQNAYDKGSNITFNCAVNCWIRGVSSTGTSRHHVSITRSAHMEISGSWFEEARSRDINAYGYGILLEACAVNILVQNNGFSHLRHAMILGSGANGNVLAFNYSRDQKWSFRGFPNILQGADLCLHGRYPYANLFEQNMVEHIYADNSHGANGPYNIFFRNLLTKGRGIIRLYRSPNTGVLGNLGASHNAAHVRYEKTEPGPDVFGLERKGRKRANHQKFTTRKGTAEEVHLPVISFFYRQRPGFLTRNYTWPAIGPAPGDVRLTQSIPARDRAVSKKRTEPAQPTQ
ncbi:ThuA domain-containing protein [bacterium]|nr:ThuA domain-containing protein [bacterium]